MRVCIVLNVKSREGGVEVPGALDEIEEAGLGVEDGVEDEGRYMRNGMCFRGVAGLRRMVEILRYVEKSSAGCPRSAYGHRA
jgi:hypothetical protein